MFAHIKIKTVSPPVACTGLRGGRDERALGGGVVGDVVSLQLGVSRFTILSILCCLSITTNLSHINFPIIKTKHFKVTKYKNVWQIFRPKWVNIKTFVIILLMNDASI